MDTGLVPYVIHCRNCFAFFVRGKVKVAPNAHFGGPDLFSVVPPGRYSLSEKVSQVTITPTCLFTTRALAIVVEESGLKVFTMTKSPMFVVNSAGEMPNLASPNWIERWTAMTGVATPDASFNVPEWVNYMKHTRPAFEPTIVLSGNWRYDAIYRNNNVRTEHTRYLEEWLDMPWVVAMNAHRLGQ
jgi:hypothetical protein